MTIVVARPFGGIARSVLVVAGLGVVIVVRCAATVSGAGDALVIGLAFGVALAALALVGGQEIAVPRVHPLLVGVAGGVALVGLALVVRQAGPGILFGQSPPFLPWVAITVLVGTSEELLLRGVLFDALQQSAGIVAAIVITSVLFALMHVPLYGWHVVPLDLGVGFWLAGLRLVSGGVAAPAVAHVLADLATWWL